MSDSNDYLREILGVKKMPSLFTPKPPSISSLYPPTNQIAVKMARQALKGVPLKIITPQQKIENELRNELRKIANFNLTRTLARILPTLDSLSFVDSKEIETSILFIDIRSSTLITATHLPDTAVKIYKMFHKAMIFAGKRYGGKVGGFAGDRIMIAFPFGKNELPRTSAVKTAIYMQYVLHNILNPILDESFKHPLKCGIGIDFGKVLVVRVGQQGQGNNDRIWAGNAANIASKLADKGDGIYISTSTYNRMDKRVLKTLPDRNWQAYVNTSNKIVYYKYTGISKPL